MGIYGLEGSIFYEDLRRKLQNPELMSPLQSSSKALSTMANKLSHYPKEPTNLQNPTKKVLVKSKTFRRFNERLSETSTHDPEA